MPSRKLVTELARRVGRNKTNVLRSLKVLKQFETWTSRRARETARRRA